MFSEIWSVWLRSRGAILNPIAGDQQHPNPCTITVLDARRPGKQFLIGFSRSRIGGDFPSAGMGWIIGIERNLIASPKE